MEVESALTTVVGGFHCYLAKIIVEVSGKKILQI
jgi:hypothetical protein